MELTVKQRLVRYLAEKGIGQNKFERLAGISNGYIYTHMTEADLIGGYEMIK